ncbi:MAG: ABC transporter ATP-binding protein [Clostridiales bacterium]|nr:ABC transporter ATP-binding protein [Clostridiales bacterium]
MTVSCESLNKTYIKNDQTIRAVADCDISFPESSFSVITGGSGSGKTTLLNMIAAFELPTSGTVMYDGTDIFRLSEAERCRFHNRTIGYVFQDFRLLTTLTVRENILTPTVISGIRPSKGFFDSLVETLGLSERLDHLPKEISGGQKQRCAVARALINSPEVLLADEPTGNLDKESADSLISLMLKLHGEYRQTMIIVTHDDKIACLADNVYRMDGGIITKVR